MATGPKIKPRRRARNEEIIAELRDAAGVYTPTDPKMVIKKKIAEVAVLMALLHGDDWRTQIDHEVGLVVVARRRRRQRRSP